MQRRYAMKYCLKHLWHVRRRGLQSVLEIPTRSMSSSNSSVEASTKEERVPETFYDAQKQPYQASTQLSKIKRPPFMKNLFVGKFDTDMLTFPEALSRDGLRLLNKRIESIHSHLESTGKELQDSQHTLDLSYLKRSGILGSLIPTEYGGLALTATEFVRICEAMSTNPYLTLTALVHHSVGSKGLLLHSSNEQKAKYLSKLANGEHLATFCLLEKNRDATLLETTAKENSDKSSYILNGTKIMVPNGDTSDLFVVFAKATTLKDQDGFPLPTEVPTSLLVPKDSGGISCKLCQEGRDIAGLNMCTVQFENTCVPKENVLGDVGKGLEIAGNILGSSRLGFGAIVAGSLKQLLDKTIHHAIHTVQYFKPLMEFQLIQEKISNIACAIYAMESMSYLTAGIVDGSVEPDYFLESTAEMIFSYEMGLWCIEECCNILKDRPKIGDMFFDEYLKSLLAALSLEGYPDFLRMYVSLVGCSHAGKEKSEGIRKLRNSVFFPNFAIKKKLRDEWRTLTNSKSSYDLPGYLHPSLVHSASQLEDGLEYLENSAEILLQRYGKDIIEYQMELKRLADMAVHMYVMTACLGRASRSYCIGLQNAEHEMVMAGTITQMSSERIKKLAEEIRLGEYNNLDAAMKKIASSAFKFKGYAAEHCLAVNWQ